MTILDPLTGQQAEIVPFERLRQRQLNRAVAKNDRVKPESSILSALQGADAIKYEYDAEAGRTVATVFANDPGDEV
jgi:hypothetical protein